jgi:hypothetical protein
MKSFFKYLPTVSELIAFFFFMVVMFFVLAATTYVVSMIYEGI